MVSEVRIIACNKDKGKPGFRWNAFMLDQISGFKSEIAFMGLDFECDKPRMNAELGVMMPEL